jgi:hypothetical protein
VSGMVAGNPGHGGAAWAILQYVLGLERLGFDVYLVEPIRKNQIVPSGESLASSANAAYLAALAHDFALDRRLSLLLEGTTETAGLPYSELRRIASTATAILNVSGMLRRAELLESIPHRVYLDLDPAFNQLWHATQNIDMGMGAHNHFVTVGTALGHADCAIPACGVDWITTLQPVVLDHWPTGGDVTRDAFTSIGNWRSYGSIEHRGVFYGQKAHSFRNLFDLPVRSRERFVLAMGIDPAETRDLEALASNGWQLVDPAAVTATPRQYGEFIRGSKAEIGVAKSGYVVSRSGWFSDRSACYLASGRPVLAEDTNFDLPCGEGLFRFSTCDDALAAIDAINRDYGRHARAARAIAAEYFDSDRVLTKMLNAVGVSQ